MASISNLDKLLNMKKGKYDKAILLQGPYSRVTIGGAKAERLRKKNERRATNGLPPKATYTEI